MDETVERLLRGMRLAALLIAVVSLVGFALPLLVTNFGSYRAPAREVAAFGLLSATALIAGTLLLLRKRMPRWPLVGVTAIASLLAVSGVHPDQVMSEAEWSYGVIGWFGLLILLDKGARATFAFLGVHVVTSAVFAHHDLAGFVVVSAVVLGYQVPFVVATTILQKLAADAAAAAKHDEELRTQEAVAEQLHQDRKKRYANLATTAVPLLTRLANGTADLQNTRGEFAVEAARMRRLFAEHDDVPDPLLHELRACVELAERRGVVVHLDTCGERPTPPTEARRTLTESAMRVLATAKHKARVTVLGGSTVTVSVVADGEVWVEDTWRP